MFFECRYSRRIWAEASAWHHCPDINQSLGATKPTILDYWKELATPPSPSGKGLQTAITLIAWEIWKERNARVFSNIFTMPSVLFQRIKSESKIWILAGAKKLAEILE